MPLFTHYIQDGKEILTPTIVVIPVILHSYFLGQITEALIVLSLGDCITLEEKIEGVFLLLIELPFLFFRGEFAPHIINIMFHEDNSPRLPFSFWLGNFRIGRSFRILHCSEVCKIQRLLKFAFLTL